METTEQSISILELRIAYGDNYIVVRNGVILGNDADNVELARVIEKKFRGTSVLITTINNAIHSREDNLPSPEVER